MKLQLGEDDWAVLRDPRSLPERLAGRLEDAQLEVIAMMPQFDPTEAEKVQDMSPAQQIKLVGVEGFKALRRMKHTAVLVYVREWSFGEVTENVLLDEVPARFVTEIFDQVGKVMRATGGPHLNREPSPDPESPTLPSND